MAKYFGTDGIRGPFGSSIMCPEFAYRLGVSLGRYMSSREDADARTLVIGRDTRGSGVTLCDALIAGLNQQGVVVYSSGVVPTPAVAAAVIEQKADMGIAVTASHNPSCDNGIKLFDRSGCKLDIEEELLIEALIDAVPSVLGNLPNPVFESIDTAGAYVTELQKMMTPGTLKGWKIVLDLANGATVETTPAVISHWGAELCIIGNTPNGENINDGVGSECPAQLAKKVVEHEAQIGVAHDGDGDRLVVSDETGCIVDGDIILALLGKYALKDGSLCADTLVATVHSNLGLDRALADAGGRVERVDVGDRNVAERMRKLGSNIGGESSGHIIFSDYATTGDGLLAAVKIIELMCKTGKKLSELRKEVLLFPLRSLNLRVANKMPLEALPALQRAMKAAEKKFGEEGRVLVRYSGTEPKLRLLVEGRNEDLVVQVLNEIETAARNDLDVIDS